MTKLQEIKDEYAREMRWDSWEQMISAWIGAAKTIDILGLITTATDEIGRRYATACCKATQTACSIAIQGVVDDVRICNKATNAVYAPDNIRII